MIDSILRWFIGSEASCSRTDHELARTFVFTHLFGPLIAQPMPIYLYAISPRLTAPFVVLTVMIWAFWALPFLLRRTGDIVLVSFLSFVMLTSASLFGAYHYGGFSSPFLPWLVVSLLLGLFYLSRHTALVLTLFAAAVAAFLLTVAFRGVPATVALADLEVLGWLSIGSATLYMTWMALCYARLVGLRSELEVEVERSRATSRELERARAVALETGQARARFFSRMSHELRTPLNAIIGYSDVLLEEAQDGPDRSERTRDLGRINAAGRHLLSLISDVLDTDRLESEALDVEVATQSVGELCDAVTAEARAEVERNGNRFVVVCPRREPALSTDLAKLRRVLLALLRNAGRVTVDGTVRLELYVDPRPADPQLRAVVSDTGPGLDPAMLPRLFEGEARPGHGAAAGTGTELAAVRRLSILLGGEIAVASTPGRGSAFTLSVPARLEPAFGRPQEAASSQQRTSPRAASA